MVGLTIKEKLKYGIGAIGSLPFVSPVIFDRTVRQFLTKVPGSHFLYGDGWNRLHPFDRVNGTNTSGSVSAADLRARCSHPANAHTNLYGGSQPSVVRRALATLPQLETCCFVDLGCGKGRPLIVASEFPFRKIVGVELSEDLAEVARTNAAVISERHPERTPIQVEVGDAAAYPIPAGDVVLFLYHSFGTELVAKVELAIRAALAAESRRLYVVSYNPVNGACFDESPVLIRRFARMLSYSREERGYGPDLSDAVVIWQGGSTPPPTELADAKIIIVTPGSRAEVTP